MNNSEKERNINLAQKLTQAWQETVEAGRLSFYMDMSEEEIRIVENRWRGWVKVSV